ncbi:MAG TPA: hypothetical protein VER03_03340, partial [Bryobacteraceae bacterium]|nr:hypothetical protein [Bryobacteraceae bacterium]
MTVSFHIDGDGGSSNNIARGGDEEAVRVLASDRDDAATLLGRQSALIVYEVEQHRSLQVFPEAEILNR